MKVNTLDDDRPGLTRCRLLGLATLTSAGLAAASVFPKPKPLQSQENSSTAWVPSKTTVFTISATRPKFTPTSFSVWNWRRPSGCRPSRRESSRHDPEEEARQVLHSVELTLKDAGMSMDDLVYVEIYCTD